MKATLLTQQIIKNDCKKQAGKKKKEEKSLTKRGKKTHNTHSHTKKQKSNSQEDSTNCGCVQG
jgi:hypothetical protein